MYLKKTKRRSKCEDDILKHMRAIRDIYLKYNPNGDYLTICIRKNIMTSNNEHWDADKDYPIEFYEIDGEKGCVYG